jgi:hypothetical protein
MSFLFVICRFDKGYPQPDAPSKRNMDARFLELDA